MMMRGGRVWRARGQAGRRPDQVGMKFPPVLLGEGYTQGGGAEEKGAEKFGRGA
jgi:hypothetical protein